MFTVALDEIAGTDDELERLLLAGLISIGVGLPPKLREDVSRRLAGSAATAGRPRWARSSCWRSWRFTTHASCEPADRCVALARRALAGGALLKAENSGEAVQCACIVLAKADLEGVLELCGDVLTDAHARGSIVDFASAKKARAQAS